MLGDQGFPAATLPWDSSEVGGSPILLVFLNPSYFPYTALALFSNRD